MASVSSVEYSEADGDIYQQFYQYDFDNDKSFQNGLQKIKERQKCTEEDILNSKLFYFSKTFHPVKKNDFKIWLSKQTDKEESQSSDRRDVHTKIIADEINTNDSIDWKTATTSNNAQTAGERNTNQEIKNAEQGEITVSNITELPLNKIIDDTCDSKESELSENLDKVLSLADVADFIEKGLPLPGIKDLDIKPLEIDPHPSSLQRKLKPWEK
ncbi:uncharacterized protein LOC127723155 [Mytilus californianus]|uniref:uncharacterized protein LOC127723155 n=1 Tax=Mytilus californianus TaxID=6549 RepID=UPI002246CBCE|nr:uncharacterized protein LOC127723155 [Mytilus californianus]